MASEPLPENRRADFSASRSRLQRRPRGAGLRERGKSEKERRIKEAAKAVFSDVGYDAATTREIARRAHVSIGTIFVYAKDKRDLLFLVLNDELDPVAERAHRDLPEAKPVLDRLCALARPWYVYFAANLTLGRYAFREMTFYEPHSIDFGEQCARYRARMRRIESWHSEIIAQGKDARRAQVQGQRRRGRQPDLQNLSRRDPQLDPRIEARCRAGHQEPADEIRHRAGWIARVVGLGSSLRSSPRRRGPWLDSRLRGNERRLFEVHSLPLVFRSETKRARIAPRPLLLTVSKTLVVHLGRLRSHPCRPCRRRPALPAWPAAPSAIRRPWLRS